MNDSDCTKSYTLNRRAVVLKKNINKMAVFFVLCLLFPFFTANAQTLIPADLMVNCNQWKITFPDGVEQKQLCTQDNNEYFYVSDNNDAIVFFVPIRSDNGSTPNSDNIRSELREREEDGSKDIYWTTDGRHMLYVEQAITHLPIKYPYLVAAQIHGNKDDGIDDAMVLRLENKKLFLSFNGGDLREDVIVKTDYELGTKHEVIFEVLDGKHYCYYSEDGNLLSAYKSGNASTYLVKDGSNDYVMDLSYDQSYFKVGNYTQSNAIKEGDEADKADNYGEVYVYNFYVEHGVVESTVATGINIVPTSSIIGVGETQELSVSFVPSNATEESVSFTSSDESVASVSSDGIVTGKKEGTATITAKSATTNLTATSQITVTNSISIPPDDLVPYDIVRLQDYLEQCKLQAPGSSTAATSAEIIDGFSSENFYVAESDKVAFYQSGSLQRTELRFLEDWYVNESNQVFHTNFKIAEQTCEQLTVIQIHDDANVGDGPNKPLLRVYSHTEKSPANHLWAALKTDAGGSTTEHFDLGEIPSGYFDCDVMIQNGTMTISVNSSEMLVYDVSYWTFPSYWKNGVYLQDEGTATTYFSELTLGTPGEITSNNNALLLSSEDLNIYLNSAKNNIVIELANVTETTYNVFKSNGQLALSGMINDKVSVIDASNLSSGVYLIKVGNYTKLINKIND